MSGLVCPGVTMTDVSDCGVSVRVTMTDVGHCGVLQRQPSDVLSVHPSTTTTRNVRTRSTTRAAFTTRNARRG